MNGAPVTKMYDVADIQRIFRVGKNTAYALMTAPGFPSIRIGRRLLVDSILLDEWLRKNRGKAIQI